MTQNFVKVSQEHKHVIVKNAGGLRGLTGPQGPQGIQGIQGPAGPQGIQGPQGPAGEAGPAGPQGAQGVQGEKGDTGATGPQGPQGPAGAGLVITGSVDTYAELPSGLGLSDAGKAYFVQADGKLYVWSGTAWPAEGEGAQFEGPQGPTGPTGATGATGPAGADGYSPTATVAKSGDTATITITDKNGTTTAQVSDGANGAPGADGFSPVATVSKVGTTTTISITDEQGTTTATVNDGVIPTIDSALSTSSENPVQNKVITAKLNDAAYVGTEVVGGTSLIGTSDIAANAITTPKIADGAVTSAKIDWTTSPFSVQAITVPGSSSRTYTFKVNTSGSGNSLLILGRGATSTHGMYIIDAWAGVITLDDTSNLVVSATGGVNDGLDTVTVTIQKTNATAVSGIVISAN